jgi:arylsulfatase A-like enzyme
MTKKRYASYLLALAAMAPGAFALPGTEGARPLPNVILIITDDQGYGDLSCLGNPILRTPALDRLHAESVRFTDFHVGPTCAPTRASLMTGHWANRTGVWHTILGRSLLRPDTPTVAELFTTAGYATGLFGKWHLGDNFPFRPEDRGFQEVVRHGAGGVGQTPDGWDNAYFDDRYYHNGVLRLFEGYCTDVFFGEAQRFMAASAAAGQPFFAYISTNAPHAPFHCPEEFVAPYRGRGLTPEEEVFLGMIANIDANVATLRAWLEEAGLADNTILIFMTDNGTATGERIYNAGMRGKKGSPYDGGHRVPFFLHWPDGGLHEGRDVDSLAGGVDFLPTLVELCGLTTPSGYRADGRSLVPLLFNLPLPWPDRVLITDSQRVVDPIKWRQSSVMTGDWRLVNGTELYAIKADPGQVKDLATTRPEVVARLRAAYEAWWAELEPTFADTVRIVVGHPEAPVVDLTAHDWLTDGTYPPWNQMMVRRGDQGKRPLGFGGTPAGTLSHRAASLAGRSRCAHPGNLASRRGRARAGRLPGDPGPGLGDRRGPLGNGWRSMDPPGGRNRHRGALRSGVAGGRRGARDATGGRRRWRAGSLFCPGDLPGTCRVRPTLICHRG